MSIYFQQKEQICARSVVLTIPRKQIRRLKWLPVHAIDKIMSHFDSIQEVPALRILFTYNTTWWKRSHPDVRHVITDLPIRQAMFLGSQNVISRDKRSIRKRHVFMVANADSTDTSYFVDIVEKLKKDNSTIRDNLVEDISKQLAKAFRINVNKMPLPESVIVQDWTHEPSGGGWHIWKKGRNWETERRHLKRPYNGDRVFLAGSAYCGGQCQLWAEGAFQTVDEMLRTYFDIR